MTTIHQEASPPPKRRLRTVLLFGGALLFLFEEWLWIVCLRLFAWLGRLGVLRWVDARLVRLAPMGALCILCIPIALLFPVKVVGLWMIASGKFFGGCAVMLAAKVASTAIIARIFLTTRTQLLQMPWFARLYNVTCALRDRVHQWQMEQPAWRDAKKWLQRLRRFLGFGYRRPAGVRGGAIRQGALRRWRRTRRKAVMAANLARSGSAQDKRR